MLGTISGYPQTACVPALVPDAALNFYQKSWVFEVWNVEIPAKISPMYRFVFPLMRYPVGDKLEGEGIFNRAHVLPFQVVP